MKTALITGITGQDGSYLAEFLLQQGYEVHGLVRRCSSMESFPNIEHISNLLHLHSGDLIDGANLHNIVMNVRPQEVYNLAAQSHVQISFECPEFTAETNAVGVLRLLEAVKTLHESQVKSNELPVRFYQASTSELFGEVVETPQNELTPFCPQSPYGVAKLYGHWMTVNYRDGYGLHASNGILFNHESPRRGETFVTRKIVKGLYNRVTSAEAPTLKLGNVNSLRDWGHARDFVRGMWLMLQQPHPSDYVLSTGVQHSVRDFVDATLKFYGQESEWVGQGTKEQCINPTTNKVYVEIDEKLYRPCDVNTLLGNSFKAHKVLGWYPEYSFQDIINDMCGAEARR